MELRADSSSADGPLGTKDLKPWHVAVLAVLALIPLVMMIGKLPAMPTEDWLNRNVSMAGFSPQITRKAHRILFVPVAAVVVVLVRLTLGLRMLGPFRSILLALAFVSTGILQGLIFFTGTVLVIVALRPAIRSLRMPYFGAASVTMSSVSFVMLAFVFAGVWLEFPTLQNITYLPIVVLCLISEAIDRTITEEGVKSAIARTVVTAAVAVPLAWVAQLPSLRNVLMDFPELLLTATASIVFIARYANWRLLDWMNPFVPTEGDKVIPGPIPE